MPSLTDKLERLELEAEKRLLEIELKEKEETISNLEKKVDEMKNKTEIPKNKSDSMMYKPAHVKIKKYGIWAAIPFGTIALFYSIIFFHENNIPLPGIYVNKTTENNKKQDMPYKSLEDRQIKEDKLKMTEKSNYNTREKEKLNLATDHYSMGVEYYRLGNHNLAVEEYKKAIEIDAKHAPAHYNLGIEYYDQGNLEMAISEYKKAIELNPKHAPAHYNLGLAYETQGNIDLAIEETRKAIQLVPDWAAYKMNLERLMEKNSR